MGKDVHPSYKRSKASETDETTFNLRNGAPGSASESENGATRFYDNRAYDGTHLGVLKETGNDDEEDKTSSKTFGFRQTFRRNLANSIRRLRRLRRNPEEGKEGEEGEEMAANSLEIEQQMRAEGYLPDLGGHGVNNREEEPQPTDPLIKSAWFYHTLSENLSLMYAILLFILGCVLYVVDLKKKGTKKYSALGEAFNVVLIIMQLIWFAVTHLDVRRYVKSVAKSLEGETNENSANQNTVSSRAPHTGADLSKQNYAGSQHYGFTSGRHGGSTYLKIGAAIFCIGYLIHTGLNFTTKIIPFFDKDKDHHFQDLLLSILQPIYAFNQLYFIFKYSNEEDSRFALMHCISASLLFWVHTIIQETLHSLHSHAHKNEHDVVGHDESVSDHSEEVEIDSKEDVLSEIQDITPYLFPFSIEYNILIIGFWILLWENIGRMDRNTHLPNVHVNEDNRLTGVAPTLSINVDCTYSNRGLFAGLFVTVISIISVILQYILSEAQNQKDYGLIVNSTTEIIFLAAMIVAAIWAFTLIRKLDVSKHITSNIDDVMLYICLPSIFLYSVFTLLAAIAEQKFQFVVVSIFQVTQVVIQTALISDGLTRRANSTTLASKKPGREIVTFLIVANVAIWLLDTFQMKLEKDNNYKYVFYGTEVWTFLSHVTLPMALFYRFHSSVCLVDIWKGAYQKDGSH